MSARLQTFQASSSLVHVYDIAQAPVENTTPNVDEMSRPVRLYWPASYPYPGRRRAAVHPAPAGLYQVCRRPISMRYMRPERLRFCRGAGPAVVAACQRLFVNRRRNQRVSGLTAVCWLPDRGRHVCFTFFSGFRPDSRPAYFDHIRSPMAASPTSNGENHEQRSGSKEIRQKGTCQNPEGEKGRQKNKESGEIAPAIKL